MKKSLNFILNQLGFIVVVLAGLLLWYDYTDFTLFFNLTVGSILFIILIASQVIYHSLIRKQEDASSVVR